MSQILIPIKTFLGKYYPELLFTAETAKYKETGLRTFFEQRFYIQGNKTQMIIDPSLDGLSVVVNGNEILVSKSLYDHPNITITNSMEVGDNSKTRNLYNPDIFSTIAYIVCQNSTMFDIIGELDEPVYIKYKSDYETFYNSILLVKVAADLNIEIVEEIESKCALNSVTNYIIAPGAHLSLTSFYQNNIAALSFMYRNIIAQDYSQYIHNIMGHGSSNVIDESRLHTYSNVKVELLGIIAPGNYDFHSIIGIQPLETTEECDILLSHRLLLSGAGTATFTPVSADQSVQADMDVTSLDVNEIPMPIRKNKVDEYVKDIADRAVLDRMIGTERFYNNKSRFLDFL